MVTGSLAGLNERIIPGFKRQDPESLRAARLIRGSLRFYLHRVTVAITGITIRVISDQIAAVTHRPPGPPAGRAGRGQ
jgi:hypothetical protein